MTHAGVAVCPHCAARFGAAAHVVGKRVPCPSCKQPFVVQLAPQPVAAPVAADPLRPSSSGLPASDPLAMPAGSILRPAVQPKRGLGARLPWTWIAGGAAGAVVLVALVAMAWSAFSRPAPGPVDAAPAVAATSPLATKPAGQPPPPPGKMAVQAVAGVAEGVAAQLPIKVSGDTHLTCLAERDRIKEELTALRELVRQGNANDEALRKCAALVLKIDDLSIRWHLLPPMTDAERQVFTERFLIEAHEDLAGNKRPAEPIKIDLASEAGETPLAVMFEMIEPLMRLSDVMRDVTAKPIAPSSPLDETYVQVCRSCRAVCRHLYRIQDAGDCDTIQSNIDGEIAAASGAIARLKGATRPNAAAVKASEEKFGERLRHEELMVEAVVKHVIARAAVKAAGGFDQAAAAALPPEIKEQFKQLIARVKEMQASHAGAVNQLAAHVQEINAAANAQRAATARQSPSSRLAYLAGAAAPLFSDAEQSAIDQAAKDVANRPLVNVMLVYVRGGKLAARQHVERDVTRRAVVERWVAIDTAEGVVIVLDCPDRAEFVARSLPYNGNVKSDDALQAVLLPLDGPIETGAGGQRQGFGMRQSATAAASATPDGARPRTFNDLVETTIQKYQQEFGADKVIVVTAQGGTAEQRKAFVTELAGHANASRWGTHEGKEAVLIVMHYEGDVQALADKVRTAKVKTVDPQKRIFLVAWK